MNESGYLENIKKRKGNSRFHRAKRVNGSVSIFAAAWFKLRRGQKTPTIPLSRLKMTHFPFPFYIISQII